MNISLNKSDRNPFFYRTEVKSIVVTSSVAAIANAEDKGNVDETRWNTNSMERAANLPTDAPWYMHARDLYASAKANAEKGTTSPILVLVTKLITPL